MLKLNHYSKMNHFTIHVLQHYYNKGTRIVKCISESRTLEYYINILIINIIPSILSKVLGMEFDN